MNEVLEKLNDRKILILGFGREGQSTLNFLRKYFPQKKIAIADQNKIQIDDPNVEIFSGENYLSKIKNYQIIFKSPGIPNKIKEIKIAKREGIEITSQTKLFFDLCRGEIIGITGTKGKSTTTSLIFHILQTAKIPSLILGNIGQPSLDYLGDDFGKGKAFVFEMSSHQLSDLTKSPHIAVFLNIFREHLDYYESFDDYFNAKANITKYQNENDFFIYNSSFLKIAKVAEETKAKKMPFNLEMNIIDLPRTTLKGEHNVNNIYAATLVARAMGISDTIIKKAITTFQPLEHRLQKVGEFRGVSFYDDTLATIPEATIAAVKSFDNGKVGSLILGGSDRGQDFTELAKFILDVKIPCLILFPTTGERIWKEITKLEKNNLPKHFFIDNMKDAVTKAYENTKRGKICLLSSASPSFSIFKNYEDKSKQFTSWVYNLSHYG